MPKCPNTGIEEPFCSCGLHAPTVSDRLRAAAAAMGERHMYYDTDGKGGVVEDGMGPTDAALIAHAKAPPKSELCLLLADTLDALMAIHHCDDDCEGECAVTRGDLCKQLGIHDLFARAGELDV